MRDEARAEVFVQYPDFAAEQTGDLSKEEALDLFENWPWAENLERFLKKEGAGADVCPPYMCMMMVGRTLGIAAEEAGTYSLIFTWSESSYELSGVPERKVEELAAALFSDEFRDVSLDAIFAAAPDNRRLPRPLWD